MNRDIKFRAWLGNEMLRDEFIIWTPDCELIGGTKINTAIKKFQEEEGFVLMQYTGLKDKNGKEIYEGDILRTNFPWPIFWEIKWDHRGGWIFRNEKENRVAHFIGNNFDKDEIIGNIYENPELKP